MLRSLAIGIAVTICLFFNRKAQSWRIIGGRRADLGEYPMMAQIMRYPSGNHSCGAIVVTSKILMSAAHCFRCGNLIWCSTQYRILVGDVSRHRSKRSPDSRQIRALKTLIPHEEYTENSFEYDIILIELFIPIVFSKNVSEGILAHIRPSVGKKCTVAGWGTNTPRQSSYTVVLLATSVRIADTRICTQRLQHFRNESMICAGDLTGRNDSCQGDSGGPLICDRNVVVGIVSFGASCALPGYAAAYTDISSYRDWISEKVGEINNVTGCKPSPLIFAALTFVFITFAINYRNFKTYNTRINTSTGDFRQSIPSLQRNLTEASLMLGFYYNGVTSNGVPQIG